MKRSRLAHALIALAVASACVAGTCSVWPEGVAGATTSDRDATTALLKTIEGAPHKELVAELVGRARSALAYGDDLRGKGDEAHARLADGLAKMWAEAARELLVAVDVEDRAQRATAASTDAGAQADRERALLEEVTARVGRLRAQLEDVERTGHEPQARTSQAARQSVSDAGATQPRTQGTRRPAPRAAVDGGAR